MVESDYHTYIINGAFIQAAKELGYEFKRDKNSNWHAVFKMGFKKNYPPETLRMRLEPEFVRQLYGIKTI